MTARRVGLALLTTAIVFSIAYMWIRAAIGHTPESDAAALITATALGFPGLIAFATTIDLR